MRTVLYVRRKDGQDSPSRTGLNATDQAFQTLAYALTRVPLQLINQSYVIDCNMWNTVNGQDVLDPEPVPADGLNLLPYVSNIGVIVPTSPDQPYFSREGALTIRAVPRTLYTFNANDPFPSQVQDSVTGLWKITVNCAGMGITTNSLKGKFLIGSGNSEWAVIASNTVSGDGNTCTLELTLGNTPGSSSAPLTRPVMAVEPTGALHNASTSQTPVLVTRGMTASLVLTGFALTHANASSSSNATGLNLQLNTVCQAILSEVEGIQVLGAPTAPVFLACRIHGNGGSSPTRTIRRINSGYLILGSLIDTIEFTSQNLGAGVSTFFQFSIIDGCAHLGDNWGHGTYDGQFRIENCYVRNSLTHGIRFNSGPVIRLANVRIDSSTKSAICAQGPGSLEAFAITGTGNAEYGILAFDGAHVTVTSATDVTGSLGDIKTGVDLAVRSWSDFRSTFPVRNEIDYAGRTLGDATRVWQESA